MASNNNCPEPMTPIPEVNGLNADKVALGARLFHYPGLLSDRTVSSASSHSSNNAGVDSQILSSGVKGQLGTRNTPTVLNSKLSFRQPHDGRTATFEQQAVIVLTSPTEMNNDCDVILDYLTSSNNYPAARFSKASILASIGGCEENNAIIPPLSLIPKAAICSGKAAGST